MGSRINSDASLSNLYCFTETWGYTFEPPTRKMTKRSHDVNEKRYLSWAIYLVLVAADFFLWVRKFIKLLLRKRFNFLFIANKTFWRSINLSILRISSHFKWEFGGIREWWYSLLFCVGQMRHLNFHSVEDLVVVFFLV